LSLGRISHPLTESGAKQMRRVIFNEKGGVGKSSITCNLAAISASRGKRTLVVDLDSQCNSTHYLLGDSPEENTVADYFDGTLEFSSKLNEPLDYVHQTPYENLSVLPSSVNLLALEHKLESRQKIYKLRDLLNKLDSEFDEIYIDTAPALNFYTRSALIAGDTVLIPFDCDAFSRQALYSILDVIYEIREDHNEGLSVGGIVVNQFQPTASLPTRLITEMKKEKLPVIPTYLNQSVKMKESHNECVPLIYYAPSHKLTGQYIALFDHLAKKRRKK
jgi:chromosome partitioning protein